MKLKFNDEQLKLLKELGFSIDADKKLLIDDFFEIDEKVSDHFACHGLGKNDEVNEVGLLCESIMDILGEQ